MCIIIVASEKPDFELLDKAEWDNPHGGGIAWREAGKVNFKKGIDAEDIFEIIKNTPSPHVIHFRIATVGGEVPKLTHPFPIGGGLELEGKADSVIFHNGHWGEWKQRLMESQLKAPMPQGPWSDTRAIAHLSQVYNNIEWISLFTDYYEFKGYGNKVAVMDTKRIKFFGNWVKHEGKDTIWLSHELLSKKDLKEYNRSRGIAEPYTIPHYKATGLVTNFEKNLQSFLNDKDYDDFDAYTKDKGIGGLRNK